MITAGIIAEFNPFHDGHRELIERVRRELHPDCLIIIVSLWFSSRGLPSVLSPEDKTRLALEAGADLVIGLPAVYAMQSADYFALYAVEALKCAGADVICFGSESADEDLLQSGASKLDQLERNPSTSLARNAQISVPDMRPNDILALQYIRAARSFGMQTRIFRRNQDLKSATAIRNDFFAGKKQTGDEFYHLRQSWSNYYPFLRLMLMESAPCRLSEFFLVEEGIENRLIRSALSCNEYERYLDQTISKTYTKARIQRTGIMILMQIDKTEMKKHAFFFDILVFGFTPAGQKHLKSLPKGAPVCSRFSDLSSWLQSCLLKEMRLYSLIDGHKAIWKVVRIQDPERKISDEKKNDESE